MRINVPLFALVYVPLMAQEPVSRVAFTESQQAIPAFSPSGAITLPAVQLKLDVKYPRGRKERGDLTVVYDPQSGTYFWRYTRLNSPGDNTSFLNAVKSGGEAVFAAPAGLVEFRMYASLYVEEHTERADSLDAAESASIDEIRRGLAVLEGRGYLKDAQTVPLGRVIGTEFVCAPVGSPEFRESKGMCHGPTSIVSVSREGDSWRFVLRNRWDQEVILDSKFNLVSTQRLPEPEKK